MSHSKSIAKSEILRFCELLGQDPERVSSITIHPSYVILEHLHPIIDDGRARPVSEHMVTNDGES